MLLPSQYTKTFIHEQYVQSCTELNVRAAKLTVFKNIWSSCCPHIQISTPRFDVCQICEKLKEKIQLATTDNEKLRATENLVKHIRDEQSERSHYLECVKLSRETIALFGPRPDYQLPPCSNNISHIHYTADFAQALSLPHHARQSGPLYFLTPRKVQLFGVCVEGIAQYNYLINEDETPGMDGSYSHGPNAVISMLHHCLEKYSYGEMACVLHCDNCPGTCKRILFMPFSFTYKLHTTY